MRQYSAYLKRMSRHFLRGNYGFLAAALICAALLSAVVNSIPSALFETSDNLPLYLSQLLISFMISVLTAMLMDGITKMTLSVSRGQQISFGDLFYAFTHQADHFLVVELVLTGISSLVHIPILYMEYLSRQEIITAFQYNLFGLCWGIAEWVLVILLTLCIRLAVFLLLDRPDLSPLTALRQSALLLRGSKGKLLYLEFSFAGMYILGILSCIIGFLWIIPYYETSFAFFYRDVINDLHE